MDNDQYREPDQQKTNDDQSARIADLEQKIEKATAEATAASGKADAARADIAKIKAAHVTGPGHSGTIGNGMQFDPAAADAGGGGSGTGGTIPNIIIAFNGTAKFCTLTGIIGANV